MPRPVGLFDDTLTAGSWFDPDNKIIGWFADELVPSPVLWRPVHLGSKLIAWHQANALVGADGSGVASWPDASGNGNTLSSGGNDPELQTVELNGLNVVRFVSANIDAMTWPNAMVSGWTEGSIFFVIKAGAETGAFTNASPCDDFGTTALGTEHYPDDSSNVHSGFLTDTAKNCGDPGAVAAWHLASFHSKASDWRYAFNGADFFTTGTNTVGANTGVPKISRGGGYYWNGDLGEIVILDEFATTDERQKVEGYYAHKWGLTAGLDAGHPYKTDPPIFVPPLVAAVGLATETDTALPLGIARPVGMSAETDTALPLAAKVVRAAGMSSETDSAFGLSAKLTRALGLASETDSALALGRTQIRALGLSSETDSAQGLAAKLIRTIGIAPETDTALRLGIASPVGLAIESDTAFARAPVLLRPAGLAGETDTAFALVAGGAAIQVGLAVESDTAVGLVARLIRANGLALETDVALALAAAVAGGRPKVWDGLQWGLKPAKVWTGSAWVEKPVKSWDGSQWILG